MGRQKIAIKRIKDERIRQVILTLILINIKVNAKSICPFFNKPIFSSDPVVGTTSHFIPSFALDITRHKFNPIL